MSSVPLSRRLYREKFEAFSAYRRNGLFPSAVAHCDLARLTFSVLESAWFKEDFDQEEIKTLSIASNLRGVDQWGAR